MRILAPPRTVFAAGLLVAFSPTPTHQQQDPLRVVNAVAKGKTCKTQAALGRIDCEYRVGDGLDFEILAVGQRDATVTIYRADFDGEYYLSIGGLHSCVTVKEGKQTRAKLGLTLEVFAFVSPKNGKVYSDWPSCNRAA